MKVTNVAAKVLLSVFLFSAVQMLAAGGNVSADKKEMVERSYREAANHIKFIENKGQWPEHVLYRADVPGAQMLATPQGMLVGKYDIKSIEENAEWLEKEEAYKAGKITKEELGAEKFVRGHGWRFNFLGGSLASQASIDAKGLQPDYYNYLVGDGKSSATNVRNFNELLYKNVYPNIDVRYYTSAEGDFENDVIVRPGGNAAKVKLQIEGIEQLRIGDNGELLFNTTVGEISIPAPISFLMNAEGKRTPIDVKYQLAGKNEIAFIVPNYDNTQTLVIDPIVLRWATYISGGSSSDAHFHAIDVDAQGNIYTTGRYNGGLVTVGAFQTSNSGTDLFISKYTEPLTPGGAGSRVWQTYLGASGTDNPYALTLGLDGYIYIVGPQGGSLAKTYGTGFSAGSWTQRSGSNTSFIAKVHPNGTGAAVRTIGATSGDWNLQFFDVRVLPTTGNNFDLVVVGRTNQQSSGGSGDIPQATQPNGTNVTNTGHDNGYALRITSNLETLVWTKQYSSSGGNTDRFNICVIDNANNVIVGGLTRGTGGISYNNPSGQTSLTGSQDGWLMRLNASNGAALWSRYFYSASGTSSSILCMETNRTKSQFIIGGTSNGLANVNITAGAYQTAYQGNTDFFVASLPIAGNATTWGTYFGGNSTEVNMMGLNLDQNDDVYVLGYSYSKNIPTVDKPLQTNSYDGSNQDAIFFKLKGDGSSLLYSTYIGGTNNETDPIGQRGIKFSNCRIYLPITTYSTNFPLSQGTLTNTKTSGGSIGEPVLVSMANPPDLVGNTITGGGNQTITCGNAPSTITAGVPSFLIAGIQRNGSNQTNGTSGAYPSGLPVITSYQWQKSIDSAATWQDIPGATGQNYTPPAINVNGVTMYRRIINGDACNRASDTLAVVNIVVTPSVATPVTTSNGPRCVGDTLRLFANSATPGVTYAWSGPNGFSSALQNPIITNVTAAAAGTYTVTATATGSGCKSYAGSVTVVINAIPSAPTAGSNSPLCAGTTLNLTASGSGSATYAWTGPNGFSSSLQNPSIANVTTAAGGSYSVTQTVSGCKSPAASVFVTINSTPTPTSTTATPNPICIGNTVQFNTSSLSGATYTWTGPAGFTATVQNPTRVITNVNMAGYYVVRRTLNGCVSAPDSVYLTVDTKPVISSAVGSNPSTCGGSQGSITLSGLTSGVQYIVNYQRNGVSQSPVTLTANGSGQVTISGLNAGTYGNFVVTVSSTGCSSTGSPANVVLSDPSSPSAPTASSNSPVCSGDTIKLTASTISGATYSWSGPASFSSSLQNPVRVNADSSFIGTYTVVATVANCPSLPATVNVVVNKRPVLTTATGTHPTTCGGSQGTITLSGLVPGVQYTVNYHRLGVPQTPVTLTANGSGEVTITGLIAGNYGGFVVTVTSTGCSSLSSPADVRLDDPLKPVPPIVGSNSPVCYGDTLKISATLIPGVTYSWTGPGGFTATTQNIERALAQISMSGTYSVVVSINNCNSNPASVNVVVQGCAPIAVDDIYVSCLDTAILGNLLTNDINTTIYPISLTTPLIFGPFSGTVSPLNSNGAFRYQPPVNFNGIDSIAYRICNSGVPSLCDTAVAVFDYRCVALPPIARNDSFSGPQDQVLNGTTVLVNDNDPLNLPLTVNTTPVSNVSNGVLVLNSNGTFTYTPNTQFVGRDTFQYQVCNNGSPVLCDTAYVFINITPVNQPPHVPDTTVTTPEDVPITVCLPITDRDVAIESYSVNVCGNPVNGVIAVGPIVNNPLVPRLVCLNYKPNTNYRGTDSICLIICDNGSPILCDTAKIKINITPVNHPPVAVDDNYTTPESTPVSGNIRNNDSDIDAVYGDTLTVTQLTTPAHGTVTVNSNGVFTYQPDTLFYGVDSFTYSVCDKGIPAPVYCDTAVVRISVLHTNKPPHVPDTTVTTPQDTPVTVCLPITDRDVAIETYSVNICGNPANGIITTGPTVNNPLLPRTVCLTYQPNTNFRSTDSICLIICDNGSPILCDTAKITIVVTPVNHPPLAVNDSYTINEDDTLTANIRLNDSDPDPSDTLTITQLTPTQHGTVTVSNNGSIIYVPNPNYTGVDSFRYVACDKGQPAPVLCDTALVVINVLPINDKPEIPDTNVTTCEECPITVCLPITDPEISTQTHTAIICGNPVNGVITSPVVNNPLIPRTLCLTYTPNTNYNGVDSICVIVCDNGSPFLCDSSKITITVTPVNDPPVANDDNYTTPEDVPLTGNVRNNDTDPDLGDTLTITPLTPPVHGTVTVNTNGTFVYTPSTNYHGVDSFKYVACDKGVPAPVLCDTATAYITIVPKNDPPVAEDIELSVEEGESVGVNVGSLVSDPEGDPVTISYPSGFPSIPGVTFVVTGNGTFDVHTSAGTAPQTLSFPYQACDIANYPVTPLCDTATVTIHILPKDTVNDPPYANNDRASTKVNVPATNISVLANDGDPNNDPITVTSIVVNPKHGTAYINVDGTINYIPNNGFVGTDTLRYRICDNGTPNLCADALVIIDVTDEPLNVNDPPFAANDYYTTDEGVAVNGNVKLNDSDPNGDPLTVTTTPLQTVSHGTVSLNSNGTFTYVPDANFYGVDSFVYRVCDNGTPSLCDTATAYITIVPKNDPPVAEDIELSVEEGESVGVNVGSLVSDPEGDPVTISYPSGFPSIPGVTFVVTGNGTFDVHTSAGTAPQTLSFPYQACDIANYPVTPLCDTATVTIHILPKDTVNDPPYANNDRASTKVNVPATNISVLANDGDPNNDPITVTSIVVNPKHGTAYINVDGTINYIPNNGFVGTDTLRYRICDNGTPNLCADALVIIDVTDEPLNVNDPPFAANDYYTTDEGVAVNGNVKLNDSDPNGDPLTVTTTPLQTVSHGTVSLNSNGTFTYVPDANFYGVDSFVYRVCDNGTPSLCDTATAYITIVPKNDPPVAEDIELSVEEGESVGVNVGSLVSDPEGDPVTISYPSGFPSIPGVTFVVTGNGTFDVHTSAGTAPQTLSFPYQACDIANYPVTPLCDTATVTIHILPKDTVNDPPYANNDRASTKVNVPATNINVLANDGDPNNDSLTVSLVSQPNNGTATQNPDGTVNYIPNNGFVGIDTFVYRVCDDGVPSLCDTALVIIDVTDEPLNVNDPPFAANDYYTTDEGVAVNGNVKLNDSDPNGDPLTVTTTPLQTVSHGTVSLNSNGTFTYVPDANFYGVDSFVYRVCDNGTPSLCDTATAYITIVPKNDPPTADTVVVYTMENTPVPVNVSLATFDPESDPLSFSYGTPSVPGTTVQPTGNGAIIVFPPTNYTGVITVPYYVCDNALYPVTPLCDTSVIIVHVLPTGDTLVNHPPVANNDYESTIKNKPVVVNVLANDFDPDGDQLVVTIYSTPSNGTVVVNGDGTVTYNPNNNFVGSDTFYYQICDPYGTTLPRPLCDNAMVVVNIVGTPNPDPNNPPVAVDDLAFICSAETVVMDLLLNDSDPNGDAISFNGIITPPTKGVLNLVSNGVYKYIPSAGFTTGSDTFYYRICDNGVPSKCDTGRGIVFVRPTPVISASPSSLVICSGDSVNIAMSSSTAAIISWTATNGTSGTGDVATTLSNVGLNDIVVTYTFTSVSAAGGCEGNTVTVPVTVKPRPTVFVNPSANLVCDGEAVVIVMASNYSGATFNWVSNTGKSGSGLFIIDTLSNRGVIDSTVTYTITPQLNGCSGTPAVVNVVVKPLPVVTLTAVDDSVCNGEQVVINAVSNVAGTTYSWNNSLGQSGSFVPVMNTPLNGTNAPLNVTYTVNSFNGSCAGTPVQKTVTVFPPVAADAGADKTVVGCSGVTVSLGGRPTAFGTAPFTYQWNPAANLNDSTVANPIASGLVSTTVFTVTVTDAYGCTATDNAVITVTPNNLAAEAGNGGAYCFGPGGFVQLGGLPTAVGGQPGYSYTWLPTTGLFNPTSANPLAQPTGTTTYNVTVTDANGCTATDSVTITVYSAPTASIGNDTSICKGFSVQLNTTVAGGKPGYTYSWTPPTGLSGFTVPNPIATPNITTFYQVTVTDANGCSVIAGKQITVNEGPAADAGTSQDVYQCGGDSVQIGGIQSFATGVPPFTYKWTPSTGLSSDTILNPWVKGITANTTYVLVVTDSNGCTGTDNVLIRSLPNNLTARAGNGGNICAGSGGSIQLGGLPTASGGTPLYTYKWSPAVGLSDSTAPNPIAAPVATTTYYLTVTDAKGCSSVDSVTITINGSITVNAGRDTAICNGFPVVIGGNPTAAGGKTPYSYMWTPSISLSQNNVANPIATPATTTNYTVMVRDSNGCTGTATVTITVNQNPVAHAGADVTLVNCYADSVQLGGTPPASGGSGNYTYLWKPTVGLSDTSVGRPFVKGIAATSLYELLVTDANGCTSTDLVLVNVVPSTLTADAGTAKQYCRGSVSPVTLGGVPTASGGAPVYTYTWLPTTGIVGSSTIANPLALPDSTTTYYVTVTDAKGCSSVDSVVVTVNPLPFAFAGRDTAVCAGQPVALGSRNFGFTYAWSPSMYLSSTASSGPVATPLSTITYTVTVTNAQGCTSTSSVTINVRQNPVADAGADKSLVVCSSDSVQIGGSPAASGGAAPYSYLWTPSAGLSDSSISNPYVKNIGSTTTYTLNVTDSFGCTATDQVVVNTVSSGLVAEAGNNAAYCKGTGTQVTLGGQPTASGGVSPITYTWIPTTGLNLNNISNPVASPDTTTTYTLVITDAKGCQAIDTVRITVFENPVVHAGKDTTLCYNGCVQLGGTPTATGGRAPFSYAWSPTTSIVPINGANPVACPVQTTTYTLTVTDANSCKGTASVLVSIAPQLVANAGSNKAINPCPKDSVTIGGSPTASGGSGAYTYAWSNASFLSSASVANPVVKNLTQSTIFTVTVTDGLGCTAISTVTVQVVPSTLQANAGTDTTICYGTANSILIGGNPTAVGGVSPYVYAWLPAAGLSNTTVANPMASPSQSTTYNVLITDAKGCTATDSVRVNVNAPISVAMGADTSVCAGDTVRLGNTTTVSGGTAPYVYTWQPTISMVNAASANPSVFPTTTTTYTLTVTDARGCTGTGAQVVNVNAKPIADAGQDKSIVNCAGASVVIGGSPAASGGSGSYTYVWQPTAGLSDSTIGNPTVSGISTTQTYTLLVTDVKGCTATDNVLVAVTPSSLVAEAGNATSICTGDTAGIRLGGTPTAAGGTPVYSYNWQPAIGLSSAADANPIAKPLATTVYYVTVTDANGCIAVDSVTITVSQKPFADAGLDTSVCNGFAVRLGANPTATSGVAPYTYSWSPVLGNVPNPVVTPIASTVYGLTVTDALGCSSTSFVTVTVRSNPVADAGTDKNLVACSADSVVLGGSPAASNGNPPYTYSWLPSGDSVANPVVKNLGASTDFVLTVTDQFGCTATDIVRVNVSQSTLQVDAGNGGSYCAGTNGSVLLGGMPTAQGGVYPYTYQWVGANLSSTTSANPLASPLQTTTYTVIVTDANGCSGSGTVTVVVHPKPVVDFVLNSSYCVSTQTIPLVGTPTGGVFSGAGVVGNSFSTVLTGSGTFSITYTYSDSLGCTNSITKPIVITPLPIVSLSNDNTEYCNNANAVTLVASPVGGKFYGAGVDSITGVFTPANATIGNNIITYVYTDQNGCSNSAVSTIKVKQAPTVSITADKDSICRGNTVALSATYSPDVFNIQWYDVNGTFLISGLTPITVTPSRMDHGYVAVAINTPNACTATDTVFIHVNQPPVAMVDTMETCEDQEVFAMLTDNDTDLEGDQMVVSIVAQPSNGSVTVVNNNGFVRYAPQPNFNGVDSFIYAVCNVECAKDCDTAMVFVNICSVNDTPTIPIVVDSIPEDSLIVICPAVFDADTDNLVVTAYACGAIHGTITRISDTCFQYTPTPNWHGIDTFCTVVCDDKGACDSNIVIITVTPRNEPPVADTIYVSTKKDTPIPVNVAAATYDPNGDPLNYGYGTPSVTGTGVTVTTNGGIVVTPPAGFTGTITIPYYVCDNAAYPVTPLCDTSIIIVTVVDTGSVNNPPVANNDYASTPKDVSVNVNVFANDFDPDNDPITVVGIIDAPNHGVINGVNNTTGVVGYQPNPGYEGCDTFTYVITDSKGGFDTADVVICIIDNPSYTNNPPVAVNDYSTTEKGTPVVIPVLNNDSDPDGNTVTVQPGLPCAPLRGTATVNQNGTITYTPGATANALQPDTFCYAICDNGNPSLCDTAVVVVTIPNSVVAVDDDTVAGLNNPVTVDIFGNDYDPESDSFCLEQIIAQPLFGSLSYTYINGDSCRPLVTYTPDSNFVGTDGFCYSIKDEWGAVDTACVTITTFVCIPPQVIGDSVFMYQDTDTLIDVLANDINYNVPLNVTMEQTSLHGGTVQVIGNKVYYQPAPGFFGNDYLIYRGSGICGSDTAYISITIFPNCSPVNAFNDYGLTLVNTPISVSVLVNDDNPNPNVLNASLISGPKHGTVALVNNVVTYTPNANFTGLDTMKYLACTRCGSETFCDSALVIIQVDTTMCPPPVANDDVIAVGYNCDGTFDVTGNDINFIGTSFTIIDSTTLGTLGYSRSGQIMYTPGGQSTIGKTDTFTYQVCNDCGVCDTGTVVIKITGFPCNGTYPVATPDTFKVCMNTVATLDPLANDYDPDGGTLALDTFSYTGSGFAVRANGKYIRYVPATNFLGTDYIFYTVCDDGTPKLCQSVGAVIVVDSCVNHPPVTNPTVIVDTTYENIPNTTCVNVSDPDGDSVHVTGSYGAVHGTITFSGTTNCFEYTPNTGYVGNDTFQVVVCDNSPYGTLCDTVTVIYTVLPIPDGQNPPVAVVDVAATDTSKPVVINIILNDYDNDGDSIAICTAPLAQPSNGTVTNNNDGTVTYTPNAGFVGVDTFTYILCDNGTPSLSDTGLVVVYVGVKPTPEARDIACDSVVTANSTLVVVNVLANDSIPYANDTIVTIAVRPLNGSVAVNGDNTVNYVPNDGFAGLDNFTYSVCVVVGNAIACDTASVCVTVIDTTVDCTFPNAFSPNNDGVNDVFDINCNPQYPQAKLRVFNRWGNEVWFSEGHYQNDWKGTNKENKDLPDGTYFYVYEYSDGTNRKEARFVVINR
ncbi:MAG: tandem-95 repeat protein [Chitinophagales bacterium]|nr:tandem-95 repeat protein [Chitinophagales bacterium]